MRRFALAAVIACSGSVLILAQHSPQVPEPGMGGIHWARGHQPPRAGLYGGRSPNLTWHRGPVMHGTVVEPIFWGPSWSTYSGDEISGLQTFYAGIGGSNYAITNTEYTDGGHVSPAVSLGATYFDSSTASSGSSTSAVLAAVCRNVINPVPNGYYPVHTDRPRGNAGFCAWHSAGTCANGVTVQFGFFFKPDGDWGCDPEDASGLHSEGLAAQVNVGGHELSEMLTDPHLNAWYDFRGDENADKCAWRFGPSLLTFPNGSQWKIQGNWSNSAYSSGTGFPNSSGQKGCIDGN